jgi:hypothetical protein
LRGEEIKVEGEEKKKTNGVALSLLYYNATSQKKDLGVVLSLLLRKLVFYYQKVLYVPFE